MLHPFLETSKRQEGSRKHRLKQLLAFIQSMGKSQKALEIVLCEPANRENLTIIGNHLLVKSYSPSKWGFRETLFNSDPSVLNYHIRAFDHQFEKGLKEMIKQYNLPVDLEKDYHDAVRQASRQSIIILDKLSA